MAYRRWVSFLMALAVAATLASAAAAQQRDAEVALQQAMQVEQVQGDLERAIRLYQDIVARHGDARTVAARAQLHIGICYETLGLQEAQRAYQQVIAEYGDQSDVVSQARTRLAALRPAPVEGRGPVARRLLSGDDMDEINVWEMVPAPDGRRVAYVDLYVGALHLRDLATGREEELVPGLPEAFNWSPCWSPDGAKLAFLQAESESDTESIKIIDLASRTVTPVPGTELTDPRQGMVGRSPIAWFPDGRSMLYLSNGDGELGVVSTGGGAPRVLADSVRAGSLSPDGRYVAYARGPDGGEQVFVQAVSGGTRRQVTDAPGRNTNPRWAPDGSAIVYQRPNGLWLERIIDGDRGGPPKLVYETADKLHLKTWTKAGGLYFARYNSVDLPLRLAMDPAEGMPVGAAEPLPNHPDRVRSFAWSPDMQRIAFAVKAQHWDEHAPRPEQGIAVYAADGSRTSLHGTTDPTEEIRRVWWSGDGREILYRSTLRVEDGGKQTVRALDPSTGAIREMFPWSSSRIAYDLSVDGNQVLFFDRQASPDTGQVGWVVAGRDGAGGRLVVPRSGPDGRVYMVQFSPQGDRLLFVRQENMSAVVSGPAGPEPATLWVVGTDGTGLSKVAAAHLIQSAVWDPSGRFIAYTAAVDNKNSVFRIVDVTTGAQRDVPLPSYPAMVTDWSRDGRFIGIVADASHYEYWAIEGLLDAVR